MAIDNERVKPIKLTDKETGKVYVLDFCRKSIELMAQNHFSFGKETFDYLANDGAELFFYAMIANDPKVTRNKASVVYHDLLGGITPKIAERLLELYMQAMDDSNVIQTDEDLEKNGKVAVEM